MAEESIPRGELAQMFARIDEKLDAIHEQTSKTNGRVTEIEQQRLLERGAALQRAATIEDVRQVRATDIARNAWLRPGAMAVLAALCGALAAHFLG